MKKKILIIHHSGVIGGAGMSLYNTWTALQKDYDVVTYVPEDPPDYMNFLAKKGLNPKTYNFRIGKLTYYSGGNSLISLRFWYHALHSLFQLKYWKSMIEDENPDLIIVNSKVLSWMSLIFKNTKSMCFVRETVRGKNNNFMNKAIRKLLDRFTMIIFISNYDLNEVNLINAKTSVTYNFLEPENYKAKLTKVEACKSLNITSDTFNVLFLGGINMLKGIDVAVEAMKYLKDENVQLIVAGKDTGKVNDTSTFRDNITNYKRRKVISFSTEIKQTIEEYKLKKNISFIGIQPDVSTAFASCDLLIFPMKKPHQARPAFEIGMQRKPVIISDFPHISEFVIDEYNGIKFTPNNPKALADAILKLKNDEELLKKLGQKNYENTLKNHTKEKSVAKLKANINYLFS
jgi:glycosyltransferase involved in cell wall biosynthesis